MSTREDRGAEIWGDLWPLVKAHDEARAALDEALSSLDAGDVLGRSMRWGIVQEMPVVDATFKDGATP